MGKNIYKPSHKELILKMELNCTKTNNQRGDTLGELPQIVIEAEKAHDRPPAIFRSWEPVTWLS